MAGGRAGDGDGGSLCSEVPCPEAGREGESIGLKHYALVVSDINFPFVGLKAFSFLRW